MMAQSGENVPFHPFSIFVVLLFSYCIMFDRHGEITGEHYIYIYMYIYINIMIFFTIINL